MAYETTSSQLLMETSQGVFQYLGRKRQKNIHTLIRENIFKDICFSWKEKQGGIKLDGDILTIIWEEPNEKEEFLNWLEDRRMNFNTCKPPEEQLSLFSNGSEEISHVPE